jgi:gamma-glutamyltranspeptidase
VALLKARGHTVEFEGSQGEVAAIRVTDGWLEGSADARTEGTAKGY